ncbi:MAG TPA: SGNH/GDSL hydrolase family protein [Candidatus Acidoferrum sp.]|nr:SGNH/GDSL hydrolase family protein [Candidatus Acidoferrum sp.]
MRLFLAIVLAGIPAALLPSPARAQVTPASYQAASQSTQAPQAVPADCAELPALKERFERAEKRLMDWPELARYRDANTTLPPPSAKENRVVFMGDSITDIWANPDNGGFFSGKPYVDRGISGQTTPQMLIRFLPDVIALHPKVVVILAGTNDIAGNTGPMTLNEIEGNLSLMDELAHSNHIRVVLASLLPVSDYEHNHEGVLIIQTKRRPPAEILELNKWMKQYASTHGDVYLDYFSVMVDDQGMLKQDLSNDGLHPNAKGYAVMAPLAEQAIQAALKKKR